MTTHTPNKHPLKFVNNNLSTAKSIPKSGAKGKIIQQKGCRHMTGWDWIWGMSKFTDTHVPHESEPNQHFAQTAAQRAFRAATNTFLLHFHSLSKLTKLDTTAQGIWLCKRDTGYRAEKLLFVSLNAFSCFSVQEKVFLLHPVLWFFVMKSEKINRF